LACLLTGCHTFPLTEHGMIWCKPNW